MKKFLIVFAVLGMFAEMSLAATVPACNYPEQREYVRDPFWGRNQTITQPKGSCDFRGSMSDTQTKLCSEVAKEQGYKCFQVGSLYTRDPFWGANTTTKLCYACF